MERRRERRAGGQFPDLRRKFRYPALKKQFGFGYRFFTVFVENGKWKKLVRHPILAVVMYFERVLVGFTYLLNK